MISCKLDEEQYQIQIYFNFNQRVVLDAKHQNLEQRRRDPAQFLAKDKKDKFLLEEEADLEQLKEEVQPSITALKEEVSVLDV